MSTSFLPTWLYNDQKIFELELDKNSKNYWHPLIFIGEIKPGEILEKKFFNQSLLISRSENNLITDLTGKIAGALSLKELIKIKKIKEAKEYAKIALSWVKEGAFVVGGCCGTTVEHTREIKLLI